jgi:hypothetical protein
MKWSSLCRQSHRWMSMAFLSGVGIYVLAMQRGRPPGWVGLFPLLPLITLAMTGLYLFILPYTRARRVAAR